MPYYSPAFVIFLKMADIPVRTQKRRVSFATENGALEAEPGNTNPSVIRSGEVGGDTNQAQFTGWH